MSFSRYNFYKFQLKFVKKYEVKITNTFNSYFAHLVDQFITDDGLNEFVPSDKFTSSVRTRLPWGASFFISCITSHAIKRSLVK